VWKTNQSSSLLVPGIESFIIDRAAESEVYVYAIGGSIDHLHLFVAIPPHLSVLQVVQDLQSTSERHINDLMPPHQPTLAWDSGFGSMTLGKGQLAEAVTYVKTQILLHADQETNAWLERASTQDEGPADPGRSPKIAAILHEKQDRYQIDMGKPPF
jgi:REP element-mobilizing transposase RayT